MKPLAILKDSLREAWDSKILLVMLILSVIFLAGVGSVSYKPATAEATFKEFGNGLSSPMVQLNHGKVSFPSKEGPLALMSVRDVKTIREGAMPASSDHEITIDVFRLDTAPNGFEKLVAAWHEDGSGKYAKILGDAGVFQAGAIELGANPITPELIRGYFAERIDAFQQMPVTGFEEVPQNDPNKRSFRLTLGPSAEPKGWLVAFGIGFGAYESGDDVKPLGMILYLIQNIVINSVAGMAIITLGIIVTSFFIPNMLRKGAIDLMLAKPLSRITLLLFKFLGGCFFVLILATVIVGGFWIITGIRAGIWTPDFLLVIPLLTFAFATLYSLSTLVAVLTRSSIACILVTLAFGGLLWLVGIVHQVAEVSRLRAENRAQMSKVEPEIAGWVKVTETLNVVLPRWNDIDRLSGKIVLDSLMTEKQRKVAGDIAMRKYPSWGGTIGVTCAWMALFLGLACWRFTEKDY